MFIKNARYTGDTFYALHPLIYASYYSTDEGFWLWRSKLDDYWYISEQLGYTIMLDGMEVTDYTYGYETATGSYLFKQDNYLIQCLITPINGDNIQGRFYAIREYLNSINDIITPYTLYRDYQLSEDNDDPRGIGEFITYYDEYGVYHSGVIQNTIDITVDEDITYDYVSYDDTYPTNNPEGMYESILGEEYDREITQSTETYNIGILPLLS